MHYIVIKNWGKYQHYSKRNPPWIKLHFSLLSSPDWVALDDASRALAIAIMLLASRDNGRVRHDLAYIKRVAYLNSEPNLKPLVSSGFVEIVDDASICVQMIADARPEKEREKETEKETDTDQSREEKKNVPPSAKKTNGALTLGEQVLWERLWAVYKHANSEGKRDAQLAFKKLKVNDTLLSDILNTLEWQIPKWAKKKDYTPCLLATYLNKRRWEDDRPPEPKKSAGVFESQEQEIPF